MVELQPTRESPARARDAISRLRGLLDQRTYADLELLVSELVTNAVRHASLAPDDLIRLEVTHSDEHLRLEVSDEGIGFNPGSPRPAPDGGSGWGLYLADRVAARWGVTKVGGMTRVWAEWDLRPG
jgi:anti-sigma regulatory factor (Ser/Thr protein kinase)